MNNYWDKIASGNRDYYYGDYDNPVRMLALKLLKDGESFLDVGCGGGLMYTLLKEHKNGIRYKGIDYGEVFIQRCKQRHPEADFELHDVGDLNKIPENSYDMVYMRHCLENIRDWKEAVVQMFRIAKKRVVIDMRRPFIRDESKIVEDIGDTVCWNINGEEFNGLVRNLSVSVSYLEANNGGWIGDSSVFCVINKKMDDVVVTLDDFHETNHQLDLLKEFKEKYPGFKATLFTIPALSEKGWLEYVKEDWLEYAVHGYFHNITNREYDDGTWYPEECLNWTTEDANKYLRMSEATGLYERLFKAPGWGMNEATYKVLKDRGYWVMDNKDRSHERPPGIDNNYETGSLLEVNGHIQEVGGNGLQTLMSHKNNFTPETKFHFLSEVVGTDFDKQNRLNYLFEQLCPSAEQTHIQE